MVIGTATRLNLIPSGVMPVIYLNQTDAGYDKQFLVYNGDQPYNVPEGVSATIRGKKGDGYGITENAELTAGSNAITIRITEQMTAVPGDCNIFELVFVDTEGLRVGTINMVFAVEPDALGDAVISDSEVSYAEHVMTELQSIHAEHIQIQQNKANIAKEVQDRISAVNAEASARQTTDTALQNNINTESNRAKAAENTLQQNINAEASTRATADTGLQAQINQLVAPSGEAPSAAEVQNARIGADNVTYPTLGEAIRTQNANLKSAVGYLSNDTTVLKAASALILGGLGESTGTAIDSTTRCRTKFFINASGGFYIDLPQGKKITLRFYKIDKTFISGTGWLTSGAEAMNRIAASGAALYKASMAYEDNRQITALNDFDGIVLFRKNNCADDNAGFVLNELISGEASDRYKSTLYIPVLGGDVIRYDVSMKGASTFFVFDDKTGTTKFTMTGEQRATRFSGFYTAPEDGYVRAASMSPNNPLYQKDGELTVLHSDSAQLAQDVKALQTEAVTVSTQKTKTPVMSILAAKYFTYNDGCLPVIDWYLLIDPATNRFYISKDLRHKKYIFTFKGDNNNPHRYKYGVLPSGDIIAVYRCEFEDKGSTYSPDLDKVRKNPYVFLASENYEVAHVVDFGTGLKPSGWLQNVGFCVLPDNSVVFCEYTREMVLYTANCWRIAAGADLIASSSWVVVKQFLVAPNDTDELDESYIEHFHAAQYDPYGKTLYITTGDLGNKSQIWYSKDYGVTFTQQRFLDNGSYVTSGQKQFRLLNITWTEDYAYWISDSASQRGIMRCSRNANGVLAEDGLVSLLDIQPTSPGWPATYGQAYLPEYNLLVMMERCDEPGASSMHFRAFDLDDGTLKTITMLHAIGGDQASGIETYIGFRTEYTEYNPRDGVIKCGFGGRWEYRNRNALFDNVVSMEWADMVNNLSVKVWKKPDGNLDCRFGVYYL